MLTISRKLNAIALNNPTKIPNTLRLFSTQSDALQKGQTNIDLNYSTIFHGKGEEFCYSLVHKGLTNTIISTVLLGAPIVYITNLAAIPLVLFGGLFTGTLGYKLYIKYNFGTKICIRIDYSQIDQKIRFYHIEKTGGLYYECNTSDISVENKQETQIYLDYIRENSELLATDNSKIGTTFVPGQNDSLPAISNDISEYAKKGDQTRQEGYEPKPMRQIIPINFLDQKSSKKRSMHLGIGFNSYCYLRQDLLKGLVLNN